MGGREVDEVDGIHVEVDPDSLFTRLSARKQSESGPDNGVSAFGFLAGFFVDVEDLWDRAGGETVDLSVFFLADDSLPFGTDDAWLSCKVEDSET